MDQLRPAIGPIVVSTWRFGAAANGAAWSKLNAGGSALDAVEAAARLTEDDPLVESVGYGGTPDAAGHVTLDACIMDDRGNCGSVVYLQHVRNAISVARLVMEESPHVMLAGDGALRFARNHGVRRENVRSARARARWRAFRRSRRSADSSAVASATEAAHRGHDTIGILAIDTSGRMAGACTTSGLAFKLPGRVGDSPVIGAGLFVDGEVGAACATGEGEEVLRIAGSHLVVEAMRHGTPPEAACRMAVERIVGRSPERARGFQVGFLALRRDGAVGACAVGGHGEPFVYALRDATHDLVITSARHFSE